MSFISDNQEAVRETIARLGDLLIAKTGEDLIRFQGETVEFSVCVGEEVLGISYGNEIADLPALKGSVNAELQFGELLALGGFFSQLYKWNYVNNFIELKSGQRFPLTPYWDWQSQSVRVKELAEEIERLCSLIPGQQEIEDALRAISSVFKV